MSKATSAFASIPSVDSMLRHPQAEELAASYGRDRVRDVLREGSSALRKRGCQPGRRAAGGQAVDPQSAVGSRTVGENYRIMMTLQFLERYVFADRDVAPKGKILKSDAMIAKNYLSEKEVSKLNRLVT